MRDSTPEARSGSGSRIALTVGVAAAAGGLWLLLNAMGVGVPPFKDLWPALLILAGCGSLIDYFFLSRQPGSAGWAVVWVGFGVLFFALTLGYTTLGRILDWLPSFPTILGLAFLTTFFAGARKADNLAIAGAVLLGLGILGFMARYDVLQRILPSAQVLWAVLLLLGGGYLVWRAVAQARR
jgi:hypothetical protein